MAERENRKIVIHVDRDLEDLVPAYLENRRKDIETIRNALEKRDFETIRVIGHTMKGSGGGYGFDAITDIGSSIEKAAKSQESQEILKWAEELANFLDRLEVVYE